MSETERRAGFVAVIGAPNAGKSTLVNALVGQKVAIVSAKAQTTRSRLMGIAIHEQAQILLVDTPGIFEPRRRLDRAMVAAAWTGAQDADVVLLLVDAKAGATEGVRAIAGDQLGRRGAFCRARWAVARRAKSPTDAYIGVDEKAFCGKIMSIRSEAEGFHNP